MFSNVNNLGFSEFEEKSNFLLIIENAIIRDCGHCTQ